MPVYKTEETKERTRKGSLYFLYLPATSEMSTLLSSPPPAVMGPIQREQRVNPRFAAPALAEDTYKMHAAGENYLSEISLARFQQPRNGGTVLLLWIILQTKKF